MMSEENIENAVDDFTIMQYFFHDFIIDDEKGREFFFFLNKYIEECEKYILITTRTKT